MSREVPKYFTRAEGNLSYPELMKVIEGVWSEVNPGTVKMYSYGTNLEEISFPCVLFNLEGRVPFDDEPKPRLREEIKLSDGGILRINGQRFADIVVFIACTDGDAEIADLLAEAWEKFMLEYTGVFKRLGISEIRYNRRYRDRLDTSWGENIVTRWMEYHVITEKVYPIDQDKLDEIALIVRSRLEDGVVGVEQIVTTIVGNGPLANLEGGDWYTDLSAPSQPRQFPYGPFSIGWEVINADVRKQLDADALTLNQLADLVCTLIDVLKKSGYIA